MLNRITALAILAISLVIAESSAAADRDIENRCQAILRAAISDAIESANHERINLALHLALEMPIEQVRGMLVKALMSDDSEARLIAAEILAQKEKGDAEVIKQQLAGLTLASPIDSVRRSAILMSLGDQDAANEIAHLAGLHEAQVATGGFVCPMQCAKPQGKAGRCPVCAMSLVKASRTATYADWESRLCALRALQQGGAKAAVDARLILTSDAHAMARLQAADIWAKEEPGKALPHLQLYLGTHYHNDALWMIAQHAPSLSQDLFESELRRPDASMLNRLAAYHGLLNAGNANHLPSVRKLARQEAKTDDSRWHKRMAIGLLGDFGSEADETLLVSLLDTEFKIDAAKSLLKMRRR